MKFSDIAGIFLVLLCLMMCTTGCTSSTTNAGSSPASGSGAAAASATTECPDKLVWDGEWQSSMLGLAGNHDLSTAWTKYKDRAYGDTAMITMKQTCWDVETTMSLPGVKCEASFRGTVDKNNVLSGTWSGSPACSKGIDDRRFSLTMAADNQSWLGDMYDSSQDPAKFPPNWAGRRPVTT